MISIDLSQTAHFALRKSETTSKAKKISDKNIFSRQNFFLDLDFVSDWIFSWTEFCLGLHTAVVFRMESFNYSLICK